MIKNKENHPQELVIDLTGPEGNVFALIGYAHRLAKQLDLDESKIVEQMKSSDYENAVKVFDDNFGSFVTLLK